MTLMTKARERIDDNRPMPHSIDMEQALLGACLMSNDAWRAVVGLVEARDFYEPVHVELWEVVDALCQRGEVANPVTIRPFLGDMDLGETTPAQYAATLAAAATSIVQAPSYARIIRDLAARRRLIEAADKAKAVAWDADAAVEVESLISDVIDRIDEARPASLKAGKTRAAASQLMADLIDKAQALADGTSVASGVTTGLGDLDAAIGGFHPGELVIVAGRPGMGKSSLATSLALQCSAPRQERGGRVLFISRELSQDAIASRLASDVAFDKHGRIAHSDIRAGRLTPRDLEALRRAETDLAAHRLIIEHAGGATLRDIEIIVQAENKRLARSGEKIDVVFVDQLKQIKASERYKGQRTYEIGEITWGLREMAKRHGFCCVLMCQVNRESEGRDVKNRRPSLGELRESGDIENDADVVLFVYREAYYLKRQLDAEQDKSRRDELEEKLSVNRHRLEIIIAKNRHGDTQTVKAFCDIAASAIRPMRQSDDSWI